MVLIEHGKNDKCSGVEKMGSHQSLFDAKTPDSMRRIGRPKFLGTSYFATLGRLYAHHAKWMWPNMLHQSP